MGKSPQRRRLPGCDDAVWCRVLFFAVDWLGTRFLRWRWQSWCIEFQRFQCENSGQSGPRSRTNEMRSSSHASTNSTDARTLSTCARAYSSAHEPESNTLRLPRRLADGVLALVSKRCIWLQGMCSGVRSSVFKHDSCMRLLFTFSNSVNL